MDKPKITPKDFFLWAGAMVAFYWSVLAFIFLIFNYINYAFPNALSYYPSDPYQSGISGQMASIIVLLPVFFWLMQVIRRDIARDASRGEIWVRRWALILTLFVAGIAIVGDLIVLLTTFLSGEELTLAFLLKVLVILLVALGVFMHFIADLKGYWERFPARKNAVRVGVAVLALVAIVSGFFIVGTPQEARRARFDDQKIQDLQTIQWQILSYWQTKERLPGSLADLNDPLAGYSVPRDSETGAEYEYQATGPTSFALCATFNAAGTGPQMGMRTAVAPTLYDKAGGLVNESWQHGAGRTCFSRTIDPERYPSIRSAR
jgi:hypothetical protein